MTCNCRTAALRIFVRSFAQLHIAEAAPTAAAAFRHQTRVGSRVQQITHPGLTGAYRGLHSSTPCRKASAETGASTSPVSSSPAAEDDSHGRREQNEREPKGEASQKAFSAVADLTPEAIDALAFEIASGSPSIKSPTTAPTFEPDQEIDESHAYSQSRSTGHTSGKERKRVKDAKKKERKPSRDREFATENEAEAKPPSEREDWQIQKEALKAKFGEEGWKPRKRLSPDALAGLRALHSQYPEQYTTEVLAKRFEVSVEAVRRILKSKWMPNAEEEEDRQQRWFKRGMKIWERNAELGMKPPKRWRLEGIKKKPFKPSRADADVNRLVSPFRTRGVKRRAFDDEDPEL